MSNKIKEIRIKNHTWLLFEGLYKDKSNTEYF